jgi:glycosyltransferase involved in cell wall biosynthesis
MNTGSGSPPSLLVINQYYEPDIAATGMILTQLCESLAAAGSEVRVVTAQPSYTESGVVAPEHEIRNGVDVYRISLGHSLGRLSMRLRVFGYFKFLYRSRKLAKRLARERRPDIVITVSNPPLLERVGRGVARSSGAAWVHIIHDIHPDVLLAGGQISLPPMVVPAWKWLSMRALRRADRLVVLSENMKRNLVETRDIGAAKIEVINLWAVPDVGELPDAAGVRERFGIPGDHLLLTHTGNIGIVQGLDSVIDAAALTSDAPATYLLVGDGAMKADLEARARELRLENVRFLPYQAQDDFLKLLAASDICLVSLREGMERYALPSKIFTYLAAGKPIAGLLHPGNDVSAILESHEVGWNATDAAGLAALVRRLCDNRDEVAVADVNARKLYLSRFDRAQGVEAYRQLFKALINRDDATG